MEEEEGGVVAEEGERVGGVVRVGEGEGGEGGERGEGQDILEREEGERGGQGRE